MLRLKKSQIFHFVSNLNWGCSKWVQTALFSSWNNSDFHCLFLIGCLISLIFYNHCSIYIPRVGGVALYMFWTQIEDKTVVSSTSVQNLNRAAPATFRTQIEQIQRMEEERTDMISATHYSMFGFYRVSTSQVNGQIWPQICAEIDL